MTKIVWVLSVAAAALAASSGLGGAGAGAAPTATGPDPAFVTRVDNPWYAQDRAGNVWYFGEATAELDARGTVTSTEGSWQAGVHGARPGIILPAHPAVGQRFRQEYYKGHAEDHFEVLSLSATVRTPVTSSRHALLTKEWTPLEPGVIDHKLYVRGIGNVREETVKGGAERAVLVAVRRS